MRPVKGAVTPDSQSLLSQVFAVMQECSPFMLFVNLSGFMSPWPHLLSSMSVTGLLWRTGRFSEVSLPDPGMPVWVAQKIVTQKTGGKLSLGLVALTPNTILSPIAFKLLINLPWSSWADHKGSGKVGHTGRERLVYSEKNGQYADS